MLISVIAIVILYYHHSVSTNINVDVEQFVLGEYGKDWLLQGLGRFGLYYSIMLFNLGFYNVYLNGIVFLCIFALAVITWVYTFYVYSKRIFSWQIVFFAISFVSYPIWMYQFYFTHQQVAIAVALLLQAVSFLLMQKILDTKKSGSQRIKTVAMAVLSILCAFWAFGTYQAFVPMHLAQAAALLLLQFDKTPDYKLIIKKVIYMAGHFLISFALYEAVCKIMKWGVNEYLKINWGGYSVSSVFKGLFADYGDILLGRGKYCGYLLILSLIVLLLFTVNYKGVINKIIYIVLILGNAFSMVSINFVLGEVAVDRARIAICFSVAFLSAYSLGKLYEMYAKSIVYKSIFFAAAAICTISIMMQVGRVERLIYTEDICEQQQREVSFDICSDILASTENETFRIVFVGKWDAPLNGAASRSGIIGRSSFRHGYKKNNVTGASRRAVMYLNASNGTSFIEGSDEDKELAVEIASSMPSYPGEGYLRQQGDLVIIKLSDEGAK